MNQKINVKKFGIASGIAASVFYVGCVLIMVITGKGGTIKFYNSILHGMDTSSIMRMNVPFLESVLGVVFTFILGGVFGGLIAFFYNMQSEK